MYDDYGHHPTEIRATLSAARQRFPGRRIVVCFQPHTEARTRYLFDDFVGCFGDADVLYVLETYAARDTKADGTSARDLVAAIAQPVPRYAETHDAARDGLVEIVRPGDVVFTMGAGDVNRVAPAVVEALGERSEKG